MKTSPKRIIQQYADNRTGGDGNRSKERKPPASDQYRIVSALKVIARYVKYSGVKVEGSGPSCSLAEVLEKQNLFINFTLAQLRCNILWKIFRNGMIEHHGLFLNLDTLKANPIIV